MDQATLYHLEDSIPASIDLMKTLAVLENKSSDEVVYLNHDKLLSLAIQLERVQSEARCARLLLVPTILKGRGFWSLFFPRRRRMARELADQYTRLTASETRAAGLALMARDAVAEVRKAILETVLEA